MCANFLGTPVGPICQTKRGNGLLSVLRYGRGRDGWAGRRPRPDQTGGVCVLVLGRWTPLALPREFIPTDFLLHFAHQVISTVTCSFAPFAQFITLKVPCA